MNTRALVKRILANLSAFRSTDLAPDGAHPKGKVLGVYSIPPAELLVVTVDSVLMPTSEGWKEVRFSEISEVRAPSDKEYGTEIELRLVDGSTAIVTVSGQQGRFRDVYEVSRFLDRASSLHGDDRTESTDLEPRLR